MKPVDAHCHLDFEQYDGDRDEVIERCKEQLEFVVNNGSNIENNQATLKLAEEHADLILPALGLHPTYTDHFDELEEVKEMIREEDPVAVGEIGLDYHHVKEEELRERQMDVFKELLKLAEQLDKPVAIHSRDAEKQVVKTLEDYDVDVMLHCFNGPPELAKKAVKDGAMIGVTAQVLYSARVQNIVREVDLENLLLETDSPFLYRGERNEPVNVKESAEKIAELKSVDKEEVIEKTTGNADKFFYT